MKNVFYETWVDIGKMMDKTDKVFLDNNCYNFSMIIFGLNNIRLVFIKKILIIFFLNVYT